MRVLLCVVVFVLSCSSSLASILPLPLGLFPSVLNKNEADFNSTKFLEQIEALESADLSFVDRRVLHKSHHSSGAAFTPEEIAPLRRSFLRFFSLLLLDSVESITPSHDVDQYWHEFILFTAAYREFCDEHFGRFIDHFPEDIETDVQPMKMNEEQVAENSERKATNADGWTVTVRYLKMLYGENWEASAEATDATATAACTSCGACVGKPSNSTGCGSCGSGGCSGKKAASKKKAGCGSCGSGGCSGKKAQKKKSGACGSCGSGGCSGKKKKASAACGSCGAKTTTVAPTPATTTTSTTAGCGSGCGSSCGSEKRKVRATPTTTTTTTTTGGCGSSCGSCSGKKATTSTASTTTTTTGSCSSCGSGGCSGKKAVRKEGAEPKSASCGSCGTSSKQPSKPLKKAACGSCSGQKAEPMMMATA